MRYKYLNLPLSKTANDLPYRDRVELYAIDPKKGKVFGGRYPDKSFGVFGGGVDPGEDMAEAARREFEEETGRTVTNVRMLPFDPVKVEWQKNPDAVVAPSKRERLKKYRGSQTHFFAGDLGPKFEGDRGADTETLLSNIRLYKYDKAKRMVDESRRKANIAALQDLLDRRENILGYLAEN